MAGKSSWIPAGIQTTSKLSWSPGKERRQVMATTPRYLIRGPAYSGRGGDMWGRGRSTSSFAGQSGLVGGVESTTVCGNLHSPPVPSTPLMPGLRFGTNNQSGAVCSVARQHLFQIGELIEGGGDAIKLLSLAGGGVSLAGLVGGGLSGQPEVAIPSALGLKRAAQGYELGAFVSTIGVGIKSAADLNPTGITADILNDRIAGAIGLGGFRKGLFF